VCVCVCVGVCVCVCGGGVGGVCVVRSKQEQEPEVDKCWYIINIYLSLNVSVKILYAFLVSSVCATNPPNSSSCSRIIVFGTL